MKKEKKAQPNLQNVMKHNHCWTEEDKNHDLESPRESQAACKTPNTHKAIDSQAYFLKSVIYGHTQEEENPPKLKTTLL